MNRSHDRRPRLPHDPNGPASKASHDRLQATPRTGTLQQDAGSSMSFMGQNHRCSLQVPYMHTSQ